MRRCYHRIGGCDGIELLGVLAAARERFSDAARQPLQRWFVRHEFVGMKRRSPRRRLSDSGPAAQGRWPWG